MRQYTATEKVFYSVIKKRRIRCLAENEEYLKDGDYEELYEINEVEVMNEISSSIIMDWEECPIIKEKTDEN